MIFDKNTVARDFEGYLPNATLSNDQAASADNGYTNPYLETVSAELPSQRVSRLLNEQLREQYGDLDGEIPLSNRLLDPLRMFRVQMNQVQLSNAQQDLLEQEGTWLPQIETANQYLQLKKQSRDLQNISTDASRPTQERDAAARQLMSVNSQILQLEPKVREDARHNPYLQDIFYSIDPLTGGFWEALTKDEFGSAWDMVKLAAGYQWSDWADDYLADVNPTNNMRHMLDRDRHLNIFGLEIGVGKLTEGQRNALWDTANKPERLDKQLAMIASELDDAKLEYDSKKEDIQEQLDDLYKPSWALDPTKIDPDYKYGFDMHEMSIKDPFGSIFYGIPHLGSSYGELGAMVAQMATTYGASKVGRLAVGATGYGKGAALLTAAIETAVNTAFQVYQRQQETDSELFDAITSRVQEDMADNPDAIYDFIQQGRRELPKMGYDVENLTDQDVFRLGLANGLSPENERFRDIIDDAKNSTSSIYWSNMALALPDILATGMFSYGGKFLSNAFGTARVLKNYRNLYDGVFGDTTKYALLKDNILKQYGRGAEQFVTGASTRLDRDVVRLANKLAKSPQNKLIVSDILQSVKDASKGVLLKGVTEGLEEGQQYIFSKKYQDKEFDNYDYGLIDGVVNMASGGLEAGLAFYGLHPEDDINNDPELIDSMKIGAFTGIFMGGVLGSGKTINNVKQLRTDIRLKQYIADMYAKNEDANKVEQFLYEANDRSNKAFDRVRSSLQIIRDNYTNEVLDKQSVEEDLNLLDTVANFTVNKNLKKRMDEMGISKMSNPTFSTVIQNAVNLYQRVEKQLQLSANLTGQVEEQAQKLVMPIGSMDADGNVVVAVDQELRDQQLSAHGLAVLDQLIKEVSNRKKFLNKVKEKYGLDVNTESIRLIEEQLKKSRESYMTMLADVSKKFRDKQGESNADVKTWGDNKVISELQSQFETTTPNVQDIDTYDKMLATKLLNDATSKYMLEHLSAYTQGKYNGDVYSMAPLFSTLTEEQQNEIIERETEKDQNEGRQPRSKKSIVSSYNLEVQREWNKENITPEQKARLLIQNDLNRRVEKVKRDQQEKQDRGNLPGSVQIDMTQGNARIVVDDRELSESERKAKEAFDNTIAGSIPEENVPSEGIDDSDILIKEGADTQTPTEPVPGDIGPGQEEESTPPIDENQPPTTSEPEVNDPTSEEQDKPSDTPEPPVDENGAAVRDDTPDVQGSPTPPDTSEPDGGIEPPQGDNNPVDPIPPSTSKKPTVKDERRPDVSDKAEPGSDRIIIIDDGHVGILDNPMDSDGNVDMDEYRTMDDAGYIDTQNELDDNFFDNPSSVSGQPDSRTVRNQNKVNHISNTFFYRPDLAEPMSMTHRELINGTWETIPMMFRTSSGKFVNNKSGQELAQKLVQPGWLSKCKTYYICRSGRMPQGDETLQDVISVYLVIEDGDDVYVLAMRDGTQSVYDELVEASGLNRLPVGSPQRTELRDKIQKQFDELRKLRSQIINAYYPKINQPGQFKGFNVQKIQLQDGTVIAIPYKNVKPVSVNQSNGQLLNEVKDGNPVFKNLTEVPLLGLQDANGNPLNSLQISQAISNDEVQIGYGNGPFAVDPFHIVSLNSEEYLYDRSGSAGKIYIIPNTSRTPSGTSTLPIVLCPKFNRDYDTNQASELPLRYDASGKVVNDGATMQPAELIYELMIGRYSSTIETGRMTEEEKAEFIRNNGNSTSVKNIVLYNDLLRLMVNQGKHTAPYYIMDDSGRFMQKFSYLIRKTLFRKATVDPISGKTRLTMTRGTIKRGYISVDGYEQESARWDITSLVKDDPRLSDQTKNNARAVAIRDIAMNTHWNMDAQFMMQPLPISIRNAVISILQNRIKHGEKVTSTTEVSLLGCEQLRFNLEDFGYTVQNDVIMPIDETSVQETKAIAWYIRTNKLMTDLSSQGFYAPFVYANGVTIDNNESTGSKEAQPADVTGPDASGKTKVKPTTKSSQNAPTSDSKAQQEPKTPKDVQTTTTKTKPRTEAYDASEQAYVEEFNNSYKWYDVRRIQKAMKEGKIKRGSAKFLQATQANLDAVNAACDGKAVFLYDGKPVTKVEQFRILSQKGSSRAAIKPADEPNTFVITPMPVQLIRTDANGGGVFSVVRGVGIMNQEEAIQWLQDTLGLDREQILLVNGIINTVSNETAYGMMRVVADAMVGRITPQILLRKDAGVGIEFHEGFHYVSLLMLSDQQRQRVYEDYRRIHKYSENLTDEEVEERLAEEFRKYMIDERRSGLRYGILKFFRQLKHYFNLMIGRPETVYQLFRSIRKGEFAQGSPQQRAIDEFVSKHPDGVYYYVPGLTDEETKKFNSISNSSQFFKVTQSLKSVMFGVFDIRSESDVYGLSFDKLFEEIQNRVDFGMISEENESLADDVLNNKELFKKYLNGYLNQLGIKITKNSVKRQNQTSEQNQEIDEEEQAQREQGNTNDMTFDREQGAVSKKTNVAMLAKLFFYSIPKYNLETVLVTDESGEQVMQKRMVPVVDDIFNLPQTVPFDEAWNRILNECWDIETFEDLRQQVARLAEYDPLFYAINQMINDTSNPMSLQQRTQIEVTIKSSKVQMDTIEWDYKQLKRKEHQRKKQMSDLVEQTGDVEMANQNIAKQMTRRLLKLWDSDRLRIIKRLPSKWSKQFFSSNNVSQIGGVNVLSEKFVNTLKYFMTTMGQNQTLAMNADVVYNKYTDKKSKVQKNPTADEVIIRRAILNSFNILFGISLDNRVLDYYVSSYDDSVYGKPSVNTGERSLDILLDLWGSKRSLQGIRGGLLQPMLQLATSGTSKIKFSSGIISIDRLFNRSNENHAINKIAQAYGHVYPSSNEFSVVGADGSLIYPISENNTVTDTLRWINKNLHNYKQKLLNTWYSKRSLLLNAVNPNFSVHRFLMLDLGDRGRKFVGITPLEDYVCKLLLTFNNRMILPTMADKGTWYSIAGLTIPKTVFHSFQWDTDLETGETSLHKAQYEFNKEVLDIFVNYFLDDFDAVYNYYVDKPKVEKNPYLYKKNYHGKIKDGKMQPGGNGGRFRYFTQLQYTDSTGVVQTINLNKQIDILEREGTNEDVLRFLSDTLQKLTGVTTTTEQAIARHRPIYEAVNNLLLHRVDDEVKAAEKLGLIGYSGGENGQYLQKNIPEDIYDYYAGLYGDTSELPQNIVANDIIKSIIANHMVYQAISIIELEKTIVGDPAYYKWAKHEVTEKYKNEDVTHEVITDTHTDKIKRLGSALSIGTNLAVQEGEDTKVHTLYADDYETGLPEFGELQSVFRNQIIIDMYSQVHPDKSPRQIYDELDTQDKIEEAYNSFTEEQRNFIDKFSKNSASPYNYQYSKEDKGQLKEENRIGGNITTTDGYVIISSTMYRRILDSIGEWDHETMDEAFDLVEGEDTKWMDDPELYNKVRNILIKPLKMIYFGTSYESDLHTSTPIIDKMAMFPLFRAFAKGDNKLIYDRMHNNKKGRIDMIAFNSAMKVGNSQTVSFYDANGKVFNADELQNKSYDKVGSKSVKKGMKLLPVYTQDLRSLRLQLNTDPHEDVDRSFGSQAGKIGFANVREDRDYSNGTRTESGSYIKRRIMQCIEALTNLGEVQVKKQFFEKKKPSDKKIASWLRKQAERDGMSMEFSSSITLNDRGQIDTPLEATPIRKLIQSKINSFVNKRVININTPGGSAIQMPHFGFRRTSKVVEQSEYALNGGNKLNFLNADGSMDVMLSINFFRHIVPVEYQATYGMMRKWLLDNNVIGRNAKPLHLGYRIPTQGLSSMFSMRCVDVTPDIFSDIIIVPDGFTSMTGSDFD